MSDVLIIGYGNPLRQDDAVGWLAGQRLSLTFDNDPSVTVICCHQLTPELAALIAETALVLLLDAAIDGTPGEVGITTVTADDRITPDATHHISPSSLLALTEQLYHKTPAAVLLSVTGHRFDLGEEISEEAQRGIGLLVERATSIVAAFQRGESLQTD